MINRYSITAEAFLMKERFAVEVPTAYKPRFNASPAQLLPVITASGREGVSWFYWGRPPQFAHNKPLGEKSINVSVETLAEKPVLKRTVLKNRCIVPADGWYAWKKIGKKTLVPHRFILTDQPVFSMAGVWEEFEDDKGERIHTFMVLTAQSNEFVAEIDDRMPVLLDRAKEEVWLQQASTEKELLDVLTPYPATSMSVYTVSPRINDPANEHPALILPTPSSDQFGNLTLFS
jgi:putative SOS response-associated peptidase YedK